MALSQFQGPPAVTKTKFARVPVSPKFKTNFSSWQRQVAVTRPGVANIQVRPGATGRSDLPRRKPMAAMPFPALSILAEVEYFLRAEKLRMLFARQAAFSAV